MVGYVDSMEQASDAVRMMTGMLNRFNHADIYIGVRRDGTVIGINISEKDVQTILDIMTDKVNHQPEVSVKIYDSDDGKQYVRIIAEGYETPYSFGSWFYGRKYRIDDDGNISWSEGLTCGMKRHR